MSDADSTPRVSIKDRIAALEKGNGGASAMPIGISPPPAKPKPKESNALAGRIAALQIQSANDKGSNDSKSENRNNAGTKVGKLKLPPGGVKIIMPGAGPPPSLLKKQKEREERKQQMIADAQKEEEGNNTSATTSSIGKLKLPPGAIKVMLPGCPPQTMMSKADGGAVEEESNDAVMSRPTMPNRKPRSRGDGGEK